MLAYIFILASVVTANLLMYTVANAEKDHIKLTHPKIITEFVLSVVFITVGLIIIN